MPNEAEKNRTMLTPEGKRKLEEELQDLKINKRAEIANEIKTARGFGDLSENAEYDEAKNAQARVESRIAQLEVMLNNCIVVDEKENPADIVSVGRAVRVFDLEYEEEDIYTVVGSSEADPAKLFVSSESPIGAALIGSHVGDTVEVNAPGGVINLKVLEVMPS